MVVPELLAAQAYVPDAVRCRIVDPEAIFLTGILGESGRKLVQAGIEFYFTQSLAKKLIAKRIAVKSAECQVITATPEAQIIATMREALDILKAKWMEREGNWALVDFMQVVLHPEQDHWMKPILEAERLSQPYVEALRPEKYHPKHRGKKVAKTKT